MAAETVLWRSREAVLVLLAVGEHWSGAQDTICSDDVVVMMMGMMAFDAHRMHADHIAYRTVLYSVKEINGVVKTRHALGPRLQVAGRPTDCSITGLAKRLPR